MNGICLHANHRPRKRNRFLSQFIECHRQKRNRHLLTGRKQHIHFTRKTIRIFINPLCKLNELIRGISHCRYHHHNLITRLFFIENSFSYCHNLFRTADGTAAKFFYN